MEKLKSSSSGLRLAFYPEHILWEQELWSRLCGHIKQWLFVVNKARAACRGPSLSSLTLTAGSSLSATVLQWTIRQLCATSLYIPFAFVHINHEPGSATDKFKCFEQSKVEKSEVFLKRTVKTESHERLFDSTALKHNVFMFIFLFTVTTAAAALSRG